MPGYVQQGGKEPVRMVAEETWHAMQAILAGPDS
jgi:hypothetical protein